jgi:hypothetical protein
MKKTVGCFTDEKLKEIANQPNTVVYQPTHDVQFEAWPANKVATVVDQICEITTKFKTKEDIEEECMRNNVLKEFSQKYMTMYKNLINFDFVQDEENIKVIKQLIFLKSAVDNNNTTMQNAQAQASEVALKSLYKRANDK